MYSYLKDDENNITPDSLLYCEIYMDKVLKKYYNKDSKFINKYKYLIMLRLNKEELTKLSKENINV